MWADQEMFRYQPLLANVEENVTKCFPLVEVTQDLWKEMEESEV